MHAAWCMCTAGLYRPRLLPRQACKMADAVICYDAIWHILSIFVQAACVYTALFHPFSSQTAYHTMS